MTTPLNGRSIVLLLVANLLSIACVVGAIALLVMGVENGWGWLLLVGWATHVTVSTSKQAAKDE